MSPISRKPISLFLAFFLSIGLSACNDETPTSKTQPLATRTYLTDAKTLPLSGNSTPQLASLTVYKSPTCGCCQEWIEHANERGFSTTIQHPEDLTGLKQKLGIPMNARSCHTAVSANGYLFEGHIPARYIHEFLANPPKDAIGLTVPAMPVGSPGMEVGDKFMPYKIWILKKDGSGELLTSIDSPEMQYQ